MLGINESHITLDDILELMDVFAIPYKACVLRLYECDILSPSKTEELYSKKWKEIQARISLTGRAERWQLNSVGTEPFSSLFDDFSFNAEHEFLTASREKSDQIFISYLKDRFNLNVDRK